MINVSQRKMLFEKWIIAANVELFGLTHVYFIPLLPRWCLAGR